MTQTLWLGVQPTLNEEHYDFIASKLEEFFGIGF
jgi:CDP-6-deoxy-D-xylo-4-hexulose-3-dehydrase